MDLIFEVVKTAFDILRDGCLLHAGIPDRWLEDQLARYGLCGTEYHDIRDQPTTSGSAKVVLAGLPGKPFTR
jgi:hypothetical protein